MGPFTLHLVEKWRQSRSLRVRPLSQDFYPLGNVGEDCKGWLQRVGSGSVLVVVWDYHCQNCLMERLIHTGLCSPEREIEMAKLTIDGLMKNAKSNGKPTEKAFDEVFEAECPAVHLLMTETAKKGGGTREGATVILWAADGRFQGCLTEREHQIKMFAAGLSVSELWAALEERVSSPSPDWQPDKRKKR